ncbi:MAG: hypothetical protein IPO97_13305 [Sphingomonadales bacterium]|nr:hypothetical protein [Sphingomonadales bacterium]
MQAAVGTTDQANEASSTYNTNGTLAMLTDAENNRTTYEHDGSGPHSEGPFFQWHARVAHQFDH